MMQRIQGAFGSSLPRSDGFAIGIAPLVAVLILPRSGLRFGYTTRRRNCRSRLRKFPRSPLRINHNDFKRLVAQNAACRVFETIENHANRHADEPGIARWSPSTARRA